MQFLEWSILGLRSARHVFVQADGDRSVTLFPMVHVGESSFYQEVYRDAAAHDAVVVEGVASSVVRRLTRAYRWIEPERLGLTLQPKFRPGATRVVHADLPGAEFDRIWRKAPWPERAVLEFAATLFGVWFRLLGDRTTLGKELSVTDRPDRDAVLDRNEKNASIGEALLTARDAALIRAVNALLSEDDGPRSIAVIYGAAHMGALAHDLHRAGFRPVEGRWARVFKA